MSGQPGTTSVEITYSAADIVSLNLLMWRFWLVMVAVMASIVVVVPIILSLVEGYPLEGSIAAIYWRFTGTMILVLIAWILLVTLVAYWVRRKRGLHGPMRLSLRNDGIAIRNRQMDAIVFWSAIRTVKIARARVFLFVTRRSALIVPRRAFHSDSAFQAFVEAAQMLHSSGDDVRPHGLTMSATAD